MDIQNYIEIAELKAGIKELLGQHPSKAPFRIPVGIAMPPKKGVPRWKRTGAPNTFNWLDQPYVRRTTRTVAQSMAADDLYNPEDDLISRIDAERAMGADDRLQEEEATFFATPREGSDDDLDESPVFSAREDGPPLWHEDERPLASQAGEDDEEYFRDDRVDPIDEEYFRDDRVDPIDEEDLGCLCIDCRGHYSNGYFLPSQEYSNSYPSGVPLEDFLNGWDHGLEFVLPDEFTGPHYADDRRIRTTYKLIGVDLWVRSENREYARKCFRRRFRRFFLMKKEDLPERVQTARHGKHGAKKRPKHKRDSIRVPRLVAARSIPRAVSSEEYETECELDFEEVCDAYDSDCARYAFEIGKYAFTYEEYVDDCDDSYGNARVVA